MHRNHRGLLLLGVKAQAVLALLGVEVVAARGLADALVELPVCGLMARGEAWVG